MAEAGEGSEQPEACSGAERGLRRASWPKAQLPCFQRRYILEEAHRRGDRVSIIVTQPRRIAAIGVAERVAAERGERCGAGAVGYAVRGESCTSAATQLLFCTTGVLLRRLESDAALCGVTHVLVDEVHERTIEGDFLLLALRNLLEAQAVDGDDDDDDGGGGGGGGSGASGGASKLRVGLMSATMDGAVLAEYLGHCPRVSFPGRAFPVTAVHLEHAVALCRHRVDPSAEWCRVSQAHSRWAARRPPPPAAERPDDHRGGTGGTPSGRSGPAAYVPVSVTLPESDRECARRYPDVGGDAWRALSQLDAEVVNVQLIVDLVTWFVSCGGLGPALDLAARYAPSSFGEDASFEGGQCVLVFLPGTREIQDVQQALAAAGRVRDATWVLPLHGSLPPDEQRRVFEPSPRGLYKVVLATNVAETSITLPDVGLVIDTGRQKEERYDPTRRMASLDDTWVSAAQAKQRRGRAGRCRPGVAFHLLTSHAHDTIAEDQQAPEVRRVPLERLVLTIKVRSR